MYHKYSSVALLILLAIFIISILSFAELEPLDLIFLNETYVPYENAHSLISINGQSITNGYDINVTNKFCINDECLDSFDNISGDNYTHPENITLRWLNVTDNISTVSFYSYRQNDSPSSPVHDVITSIPKNPINDTNTKMILRHTPTGVGFLFDTGYSSVNIFSSDNDGNVAWGSNSNVSIDDNIFVSETANLVGGKKLKWVTGSKYVSLTATPFLGSVDWSLDEAGGGELAGRSVSNLFTATNSFSGFNNYFGQNILHYGDSDTGIVYTTDTFSLKAGGLTMVKLYESALVDYLTLGATNTPIDVRVSNGNFLTPKYTIYSDASSNSVGINVQTDSDITETLHVEGDTYIDKDLKVNGSFIWADYISITTNADATASTNYDIFDEDSYASYSYINNSVKDIYYNVTDGTFKIRKTGVYKIDLNGFVTASGSQLYQYNITNNGVPVYDTHTYYIHSSVDPVERSISLILDLTTDDKLNFKVRSNNLINTMIMVDGTTVTMVRIA